MASNTALDVATLEASAQTIFNLNERIDWNVALDSVEEEFDFYSVFDFPSLVRTARGIAEASDLDWDDMLERIEEAADLYIVPEDVVADLIEAFENDSYLALQKRYTDAAAQMADMGAVRSSTFTGMRSRLIAEHIRNTNRFSSEVRIDQQRLRVQAVTSQINNLKEVILAKLTFLMSTVDLVNRVLITRYDNIDRSSNFFLRTDGANIEMAFRAIELLSKNKMFQYEVEQRAVEQMSRLLLHKIQANASAVQFQGELNRIAIVANVDQYNRDLDIDVENMVWNAKAWQFATNALGSIGGGSVVYDYDKETVKQSGAGAASIAGGALSGAASGAMMGSAVGPWGTVIGAVGGAIFGGFASSASGK